MPMPLITQSRSTGGKSEMLSSAGGTRTDNTSVRSDRAATEMKLGELIEETRKEVLPLVHEEFRDMSPDDITSVGKLLVFSCGLHGLVHMAETAGKSLLEAEKGLFGGSIPSAAPQMSSPSESGTVRLVHTACKAFARGGDARNGCHLQFMAHVQPFLNAHNMTTLPLTPFRGNRFNILFSNVGHLFFLLQEMVAFPNHSDNNLLLKCVLHDLTTPEFKAGLKALGLISKFVTTPLWGLIENQQMHVFEMASQAALNPQHFLAGKLLPFGNTTPIKRDAILECLLAPSPEDDKVQTILGVMLPAFTKLCEHLYRDFLPGGQYESVDNESKMYAMARCVPKHNKFSETIFGYLDGLMMRKPNIGLLAAEAYVMFCKNKTAAWLAHKPTAEVRVLLSSASKEFKLVLANFKERHAQIIEQRRQANQEKLAKEEEARKRQLRELEKYSADIIYNGLWQSSSEVDNMLATLETKKLKVAALQAQLRFRQHVLQQNTGDKSVYRFSSGKHALSVQELTNNLKTLLVHAATLSQDDNAQTTPIRRGD